MTKKNKLIIIVCDKMKEINWTKNRFKKTAGNVCTYVPAIIVGKYILEEKTQYWPSNFSHCNNKKRWANYGKKQIK